MLYKYTGVRTSILGNFNSTNAIVLIIYVDGDVYNIVYNYNRGLFFVMHGNESPITKWVEACM